MVRRGLHNRGGGKVTVNGLATILRNPFYIGLMRILKNAETYKGSHEALIPVALFERVAGCSVRKTSGQLLAMYSRIAESFVAPPASIRLSPNAKKGHVYYRCHTVRSRILPSAHNFNTRGTARSCRARCLAESAALEMQN